MESGKNNVLVVHFMSLIHRAPMGQLSTLQDLLNTTWKHIKEIYKFWQIDIIYDSWLAERVRKT